MTRATCPDCGVKIGRLHKSGCDVARCTQCGEQFMCCENHQRTGNSVWTGYWDGEVLAVAAGRFVKWVEGSGWAACTVGDSGATPDLNWAAVAHPLALGTLERLERERKEAQQAAVEDMVQRLPVDKRPVTRSPPKEEDKDG